MSSDEDELLELCSDEDIAEELQALYSTELNEDEIDTALMKISHPDSDRRRRNENNPSRSRFVCEEEDCQWGNAETIPYSQLEPDRWPKLTDDEKDHIAMYHKNLHIRLQHYELDKKRNELEKKCIRNNFQNAVLKHKNSIIISGFIRQYNENHTVVFPSYVVVLITLMYDCNGILVIGKVNVGKTSLLNKYLFDIFEYDTKPRKFNIVADEKNTDKLIVFKICDLINNVQEFVKNMNRSLPLYISTIMFVYNINNKETFDSIDRIRNAKILAEDECDMVLIGNKCDWDETLRQVSKEDAAQYAKTNNMLFCE
eukprot:94046_1